MDFDKVMAFLIFRVILLLGEVLREISNSSYCQSATKISSNSANVVRNDFLILFYPHIGSTGKVSDTFSSAIGNHL